MKLTLSVGSADLGDGFKTYSMLPSPGMQGETIVLCKIRPSLLALVHDDFLAMLKKAMLLSVSTVAPGSTSEVVDAPFESSDDGSSKEALQAEPTEVAADPTPDELMNGCTVGEQFNSLLKMLHEKNPDLKMSPNELRERRRMFYADAHAMHFLLMWATEHKEPTAEQLLGGFEKEIDDFMSDLGKGA